MKKILYLGLDPDRYPHKGELHHYPVISIRPLPASSPEFREALDDLPQYTHFIFTSRSSVKVMMAKMKELGYPKELIAEKCIIAVGRSTAQDLEECGCPPKKVAKNETAEGVVELLKEEGLKNAYVFYPRSAIARPVIENYLKESNIKYRACTIYDTETQNTLPLPNPEDYDEFVFTSPSTVDAFISIFGKLPTNKCMTPIGPVTATYLDEKSRS